MSPTKIAEVTLPNGVTVPVVPAEFARETAETRRLRASIAEALDRGLSVTIMRDGILVRINPDRSETVVEVRS